MPRRLYVYFMLLLHGALRYPQKSGGVNGNVDTEEATRIVDPGNATLPPKMADRSLDKMTEATFKQTTVVISKT